MMQVTNITYIVPQRYHHTIILSSLAILCYMSTFWIWSTYSKSCYRLEALTNAGLRTSHLQSFKTLT